MFGNHIELNQKSNFKSFVSKENYQETLPFFCYYSYLTLLTTHVCRKILFIQIYDKLFRKPRQQDCLIISNDYM